MGEAARTPETVCVVDKDKEEDCDLFKCEECGRVCPDEETLQNHNAVHTKEKPFKCSNCCYRTDSARRLKQHCFKHKASERYVCEICSASFKWKPNLVNHMKLHNGIGLHVCGICGKKCISPSHLERHQDVHNTTALYKCKLCDHTFKHKQNINQHMKLHSGRGLHKCKICKKSFTGSAILSKHMDTHSRKPKYECDECGKKFKAQSLLRYHMRLHTKENVSVCPHCGKLFPVMSKLVKHMECHADGPQFECTDCGKKYKHQRALQRHRQVKHLDKNVHACKLCGKKFPSQSTLGYHMDSHATKDQYKCPVCGEKFRRVRALRYHQKLHSGHGLLKCQTCEKTFFTPSALKCHLECHSSGKFACDICGRLYSQKRALERHRETHNSESDPVKCNECGKTFSHLSYLKQHQKLHTGKGLLVCPICKKKFVKSHDLRRHQDTHNKEAQYKCETCGKCYRHKCDLTAHRKIHTGQAIVCAECGKMFATKQQLQCHIIVHTNDTPHKCETCGRCFKYEYSLVKHIKKHMYFGLNKSKKMVSIVVTNEGKQVDVRRSAGGWKKYNKSGAKNESCKEENDHHGEKVKRSRRNVTVNSNNDHDHGNDEHVSPGTALVKHKGKVQCKSKKGAAMKNQVDKSRRKPVLKKDDSLQESKEKPKKSTVPAVKKNALPASNNLRRKEREMDGLKQSKRIASKFVSGTMVSNFMENSGERTEKLSVLNNDGIVNKCGECLKLIQQNCVPAACVHKRKLLVSLVRIDAAIFLDMEADKSEFGDCNEVMAECYEPLSPDDILAGDDAVLKDNCISSNELTESPECHFANVEADFIGHIGESQDKQILENCRKQSEVEKSAPECEVFFEPCVQSNDNSGLGVDSQSGQFLGRNHFEKLRLITSKAILERKKEENLALAVNQTHNIVWQGHSISNSSVCHGDQVPSVSSCDMLHKEKVGCHNTLLLDTTRESADNKESNRTVIKTLQKSNDIRSLQDGIHTGEMNVISVGPRKGLGAFNELQKNQNINANLDDGLDHVTTVEGMSHSLGPGSGGVILSGSNEDVVTGEAKRMQWDDTDAHIKSRDGSSANDMLISTSTPANNINLDVFSCDCNSGSDSGCIHVERDYFPHVGSSPTNFSADTPPSSSVVGDAELNSMNLPVSVSCSSESRAEDMDPSLQPLDLSCPRKTIRPKRESVLEDHLDAERKALQAHYDQDTTFSAFYGQSWDKTATIEENRKLARLQIEGHPGHSSMGDNRTDFIGGNSGIAAGTVLIPQRSNFQNYHHQWPRNTDLAEFDEFRCASATKVHDCGDQQHNFASSPGFIPSSAHGGPMLQHLQFPASDHGTEHS